MLQVTAILCFKLQLLHQRGRFSPFWDKKKGRSFLPCGLCDYPIPCARLKLSRNAPSFAVAWNWRIVLSSLNADVKAFERLQSVLAWNASCSG